MLNAEWARNESAEPGLGPSQRGLFEGASSMMELPNSPTNEDSALDLGTEQNLRKLLSDVQKLRKANPAPAPEPIVGESYVTHYLERARVHYANQNFKASLEILHDGLKLVPGNPEILAFAEEVRGASERRQAEMEQSGLTDRIALCKAEAIKLFEEGRYGDCIERFKVLADLDPTNGDLRDFLEVSREQVGKAQSTLLTPPLQEEVVQPQQAEVSSKDSQISEPGLPAQSSPEPVCAAVETEKVVEPDFSARPFDPVQPESKDDSVVSKPSTTQDLSSEYPVAVQVQQLRLKAREEKRKLAEQETAADPDLPADSSQTDRKKVAVACLAGGGLVIGAMLGTWLALAPGRHSNVPQEAPATVESNPTAIAPVESPTPPAVATEGTDHQGQAQRAFQQGRLLEANRLCDGILQSAPDNPFALDLKQQIRARYMKIASRAAADQKWADASMAWHNVLKVLPDDPEAARQLKAAKGNLKKEEQLALTRKMEAEQRIGELHQQITLAMRSGRHLPPGPGNAFELIQQLESQSPQDAFGRDRREEIFRHLLASANRSLQAKDSVRASALVRQIETYFPEAVELKGLHDGLKIEQARLADSRTSWIQKAEAAMAAGRFVTPASDNVMAYCSELLALEPQDAKALELKKTSVARAGTQAKAWIQDGKYDEARAVYSALLYLPVAELQASISSQEIKAEIEKLTFSAHAVIHDHTLGSCSGRLRFNGYQIAYVPSSDSKDGFSAKMTEVSQVEADDKLKIQLKGKTYRFQMNGVKDPQEIRARITSIQRQLNALVASK